MEPEPEFRTPNKLPDDPHRWARDHALSLAPKSAALSVHHNHLMPLTTSCTASDFHGTRGEKQWPILKVLLFHFVTFPKIMAKCIGPALFQIFRDLPFGGPTSLLPCPSAQAGQVCGSCLPSPLLPCFYWHMPFTSSLTAHGLNVFLFVTAHKTILKKNYISLTYFKFIFQHLLLISSAF